MCVTGTHFVCCVLHNTLDSGRMGPLPTAQKILPSSPRDMQEHVGYGLACSQKIIQVCRLKKSRDLSPGLMYFIISLTLDLGLVC